MKKSYTLISIIVLSLLLSAVFFWPKRDSQSTIKNPNISKIQVSKIKPDNNDPFDEGKMTILKTWTFTKDEDISVIFNKNVIGPFAPLPPNVSGDNYSTYYVRIIHTGNSVEDWLLRLDDKFEKDGSAENKYNLGRYVFIPKQYVKKIGDLLKK